MNYELRDAVFLGFKVTKSLFFYKEWYFWF